MPEMSNAAVSNRESSMLRSKERANDFCSLLCAFRLLDVMGNLETPSDQIRPPVHKKMELNLSKNEVRVLSISFINFISQQTETFTLFCKLDSNFEKVPPEFHII
jgi:hypothetical protein